MVNLVRSTFVFADGLIRRAGHLRLPRLGREALGAKGRLLGWTPLVRGAVRRRAAAELTAFMAAERAQPTE